MINMFLTTMYSNIIKLLYLITFLLTVIQPVFMYSIVLLIQYIIVNGSVPINNSLYLNAVEIFPCIRFINDLVPPHNGHHIPVVFINRHVNLISSTKYTIIKPTSSIVAINTTSTLNFSSLSAKKSISSVRLCAPTLIL